MKSIKELVATIREWSSPREAYHRGTKCAFLLSCSLESNPASAECLSELDVGSDLKDFWRISESADLFKDMKYGQWGLKLLSPSEAKVATAAERHDSTSEFTDSDVVVGEFYGDSELLIVDGRQAEEGVYPVLVKLPLDDRREWPRVANSFADFLEQFVESQGDKYWEVT